MTDQTVTDPWQSLTAELDLWRAAGRTACFWWRDDDAANPSPALERLIALTRHAAPLVLASVPGKATPALAERTRSEPLVEIVQHGWMHLNHSPSGEKASEFPAARPLDNRIADLTQGRDRLATLFGPQFIPVFVPPWNRIGPDLAALLPEFGLIGLSTFGPRRQQAGGRVVNTHVDPIAWKDGRRFRGESHALKQVVEHLTARRLGTADADEPTGILTHHLDHDGPMWDWLEAFFTRLKNEPAARWLNARQAFN